jgi:hypothetical protein
MVIGASGPLPVDSLYGGCGSGALLLRRFEHLRACNGDLDLCEPSSVADPVTMLAKEPIGIRACAPP